MNCRHIDNKKNEHRCEFLCRFVSFFHSWCYDLSGSYRDECVLKSRRFPPLNALMSAEPWIYDKCEICGVCNATSSHSLVWSELKTINVFSEFNKLSLHICNSKLCKTILLSSPDTKSLNKLKKELDK